MLNQIFNLAYANIAEIFAAGSAIVAVTSAMSAKRETKRQRELMQERLRQNIDTASLDWGNQAIETMGQAAMFARNRHTHGSDAAFQGLKESHMVTLSALVERGRMFFPNLNESSKGAEKEGAYRGHRPPILDCLLWTYFELDCMTRDGGPTGKNSADFIDDCRRLLVSELQAHLDPRRMNEIVERYDDQSRKNREEALQRSADLKAELKRRRPNHSAGDDPAPAAAEDKPKRKGMFQ